MKLVISAAAFAATLGGWAALTAATPPAEAVVAPLAAAEPAPATTFAPLPTLVPVVGEALGGRPVSAAAPAPLLREVSAPPVSQLVAVARTRSSR